MFLKTSAGISPHKKAHLGSAIGMWWRCGGPECICYSLDVFVVAEYCICIVEHDVFVAAQDIFVGWLQMEHGCAAPPPQASLLPVHWKAAFRSRDRAGELFKSGASPSVQKEILDHTIKHMNLFQSRALPQHRHTWSRLSKEGQLVEEMFFQMNWIIWVGRPVAKRTVRCNHFFNEPDHHARPVERQF